MSELTLKFTGFKAVIVLAAIVGLAGYRCSVARATLGIEAAAG